MHRNSYTTRHNPIRMSEGCGVVSLDCAVSIMLGVAPVDGVEAWSGHVGMWACSCMEQLASWLEAVELMWP
jgi:hypothetical protein